MSLFGGNKVHFISVYSVGYYMWQKKQKQNMMTHV